MATDLTASNDRAATGAPEVAYILSPSYSGSTLLTLLLAGHPDIGTIGELKATAMGDVDRYVCSCGEGITRCAFWTAVGEALARRGVAFDLGDFGTHFRAPGRLVADRALRAVYRGPLFEACRDAALKWLPAGRVALRSVIDRNDALIRTVLDLQEARVFLDGSKDVIRLRHMLDSGRWAIRVIHLVRDGRGAANSYMKHNACGMAEAAKMWVRTNRQCERLLARMDPDAWIRLRYEDLCRAPADALGEPLRLLGCEPVRADADLRAANHHILGNRMRLRSVGDIRLDEKWRRDLSAADLAAFDRIAGDPNRRYGYT